MRSGPIESAAERKGASVGPEGPYGALKLIFACRPERARMDISAQAQRPIESAAERNRASVGPEGRTERSN